jgi:hypothetical protein
MRLHGDRACHVASSAGETLAAAVFAQGDHLLASSACDVIDDLVLHGEVVPVSPGITSPSVRDIWHQWARRISVRVTIQVLLV